MVVDRSALLAILESEQDANLYATAILYADRLFISAVNVHETSVVLRGRHGRAALKQLWDMLEEENNFEIMTFDRRQIIAALAALDRYGKGIHSTARLNLADCAAYALAKTLNLPLLFKGKDFAATDVHSVL